MHMTMINSLIWFVSLADTITGVHTVLISSTQIGVTQKQLINYLQRYQTRLNAKNATYIRELLVVLKALVSFAQRWAARYKQSQDHTSACDMYTANTFLHELNIDNINMLELQQFLKDSHLARKVRNMFSLRSIADKCILLS
jgi:chromosome transmission fidelity protein 1